MNNYILPAKGFCLPPLKDHLEAFGHKEAFDFVRELVSKRAPLSETVIKQIHNLVLLNRREERGVYRRVPVKILGAKNELCEPVLIQTKMLELLDEYEKSKDHLISKLAKFHIEFETIHPFIDVEGLVGFL